MNKLVIGLVMAVVLAATGHVQAAIVNGGFETGDFTGWTVTIPSGGEALVVTDHVGDNSSTYLPVEGTYFARLKTDGSGSSTTIKQTVLVGAGERLFGWAAFDYQDYDPYNDYAYVQILDALGSVIATPWAEYGLDHPNYWDGPWTFWSWTSSVSQTVTVVLGIANEGDDQCDSYALFDGVGVVPEPSPFLVWSGLGPIGAIFAWKRKRRAV